MINHETEKTTKNLTTKLITPFNAMENMKSTIEFN